MTNLPFTIEQNTRGINQGRCKQCQNPFRKNDYFVLLEKAKINKISLIKLCPNCFLKPLVDKMGWKKIEELILKRLGDKI